MTTKSESELRQKVEMDKIVNENIVSQSETVRMSILVLNVLKSDIMYLYLRPYISITENFKESNPDSAVLFYSNVFVYNVSIYVMLQIKNLNSFADKLVTDILEEYAYLDPVKVETKDCGANYSREFNHTFKITNEIEIRLGITASVKADSTSCRRIITGYEPAEPRPVYRLECDGSTSTAYES